MAHGEFTAARFAVRDEKRREIDADDQEDEDDGAAEHDQAVALSADDVVVQRPGDREMPFRVVIGKRLRPVMAQRLQLCLRLLWRHAGGEPCHGQQSMALARVGCGIDA